MLFSKKRQRVDVEERESGKELGGVEGGESIVKVNGMRKKIYFE